MDNYEIQLQNMLKSENNKHNAVRKYTLKVENNENGNLLKLHHTIQENDDAGAASRLVRVRLAASCFNEYGQFVLIDKRGNAFVFDFAEKRFWKIPEPIQKVNVVKACRLERNHYFAGTKQGMLVEFDTGNCILVRELQVCQQAINAISFAKQQDKNRNIALLQAGREAILLNINKLVATHRLDFDAVRITLKFASFIPFSDEIFTCFTNDAMHVWSTITLNSLRNVNVKKACERKLRLMQNEAIAEFKLTKTSNEFADECILPDYTDGNIMCYCYTTDGRQVCFATTDNYLLFLSVGSLEQQHIYRLNNFLLKQCAILPNINDIVVVGLTNNGKVVLLDCSNTDVQLLLELEEKVANLCISQDGKLMSIFLENDEAQVWSLSYMYNKLKSQQRSMEMLKSAFKEDSKTNLSAVLQNPVDPILCKLLTQKRITELLTEYKCFPAKFRALIWCSLLHLPSNNREYQQLLKSGIPSSVKSAAERIEFKNETIKRIVVKVWSCLAQWCKVFAYSEFIPKLIFPFVKAMPKNSFVVFEVMATLLLNHFQLWFEFHPLEPANYLAMIENMLKHFDLKLCQFYAKHKVSSKDYAWSLLSNAFSEVLDDEQWLILWDNIMANETDYLVYCTVAYNMMQREVIIRLPDKDTVQQIFREQNPIDIVKLISKANKLRETCPAHLQPSRYIKTLEPIPKNVYPKFLKYPRERLAEQETKIAEMKVEQRNIDQRIRQLELEEIRMLERLEDGLKKEEDAKRVKELERVYQDTIRREEERIATQRKLLLLYQKEVRQRKSEMVCTLEQSEQRRKQLLMETNMESLNREIESERLRNDIQLMLADEQLRNYELESHVQKCYTNSNEPELAEKYSDNLQRLHKERDCLKRNVRDFQADAVLSHRSAVRTPSTLENFEQKLMDICKEFSELSK